MHLVGFENGRWNAAEFGFDGVVVSNHDRISRSRLPSLIGKVRRRVLRSPTLSPLLGKLKHGPLHTYRYEDAMKFFLEDGTVSEYYPCIIPNWDNTPRSGMHGVVLTGSTPELFRRHLRDGLAKVAPYPGERRLVFLKSWNEWAEGNYVEPDVRFGMEYLAVIRDEVSRSRGGERGAAAEVCAAEEMGDRRG